MKVCSVDGCNEKHAALGYCLSHYRALRRYGKPELKRTGVNRIHPEKCFVPGCNNEYKSRGLCAKHYQLIISSGLNSKIKCSMRGCSIGVYAKGLCRKHYAAHSYREKQPVRYTCLYPDCNKKVRKTGQDFCSQHFIRGQKAIAPQVHPNKGPNNINWNGGSSEYPNHYIFKKNRLIILERCNYKCECGDQAKIVHHIDNNKSNHDLNNLRAHCHKCHHKHHKVGKPKGSKNKISKTIKKYGRTLTQISIDTGFSYGYIVRLHSSNSLMYWLMQSSQTKEKRSYTNDAEYF